MYAQNGPVYYPHVIFIGDRRVGKTSLLRRFVDEGRSAGPKSETQTIDSEFLEKEMLIGKHSSEIIPTKVRLFDSPFTLTGSPPSMSR